MTNFSKIFKLAILYKNMKKSVLICLLFFLVFVGMIGAENNDLPTCIGTETSSCNSVGIDKCDNRYELSIESEDNKKGIQCQIIPASGNIPAECSFSDLNGNVNFCKLPKCGNGKIDPGEECEFDGQCTEFNEDGQKYVCRNCDCVDPKRSGAVGEEGKSGPEGERGIVNCNSQQYTSEEDSCPTQLLEGNCEDYYVSVDGTTYNCQQGFYPGRYRPGKYCRYETYGEDSTRCGACVLKTIEVDKTKISAGDYTKLTVTGKNCDGVGLDQGLKVTAQEKDFLVHGKDFDLKDYFYYPDPYFETDTFSVSFTLPEEDDGPLGGDPEFEVEVQIDGSSVKSDLITVSSRGKGNIGCPTDCSNCAETYIVDFDFDHESYSGSTRYHNTKGKLYLINKDEEGSGYCDWVIDGTRSYSETKDENKEVVKSKKNAFVLAGSIICDEEYGEWFLRTSKRSGRASITRDNEGKICPPTTGWTFRDGSLIKKFNKFEISTEEKSEEDKEQTCTTNQDCSDEDYCNLELQQCASKRESPNHCTGDGKWIDENGVEIISIDILGKPETKVYPLVISHRGKEEICKNKDVNFYIKRKGAKGDIAVDEVPKAVFDKNGWAVSREGWNPIQIENKNQYYFIAKIVPEGQNEKQKTVEPKSETITVTQTGKDNEYKLDKKPCEEDSDCPESMVCNDESVCEEPEEKKKGFFGKVSELIGKWIDKIFKRKDEKKEEGKCLCSGEGKWPAEEGACSDSEYEIASRLAEDNCIRKACAENEEGELINPVFERKEERNKKGNLICVSKITSSEVVCSEGECQYDIIPWADEEDEDHDEEKEKPEDDENKAPTILPEQETISLIDCSTDQPCTEGKYCDGELVCDIVSEEAESDTESCEQSCEGYGIITNCQLSKEECLLKAENKAKVECVKAVCDEDADNNFRSIAVFEDKNSFELKNKYYASDVSRCVICTDFVTEPEPEEVEPEPEEDAKTSIKNICPSDLNRDGKTDYADLEIYSKEKYYSTKKCNEENNWCYSGDTNKDSYFSLDEFTEGYGLTDCPV